MVVVDAVDAVFVLLLLLFWKEDDRSLNWESISFCFLLLSTTKGRIISTCEGNTETVRYWMQVEE